MEWNIKLDLDVVAQYAERYGVTLQEAEDNLLSLIAKDISAERAALQETVEKYWSPSEIERANTADILAGGSPE